MKSIGFLVLFSVSSAFAVVKNPLIRICLTTGGVPHEMHVENDQVMFCEYGSALMDSQSILDVVTSRQTSQAVSALQNSASQICEDAGARSLYTMDLDNNPFNVCIFDDGSAIELSTLQSGAQSSQNSGLMRALETRY